MKFRADDRQSRHNIEFAASLLQLRQHKRSKKECANDIDLDGTFVASYQLEILGLCVSCQSLPPTSRMEFLLLRMPAFSTRESIRCRPCAFAAKCLMLS